MNKDTGGPAFPDPWEHDGMTLRDYFAAKVLQSYMVDEIWRDDVYKDAVRTSYRVADAMLKEREK